MRHITHRLIRTALVAATLAAVLTPAPAAADLRATAFAGALYGVDPFDQPAVEECKKIAYGLMGRKGFEQFADKVRSGDGNSRWKLT